MCLASNFAPCWQRYVLKNDIFVKKESNLDRETADPCLLRHFCVYCRVQFNLLHFLPSLLNHPVHIFHEIKGSQHDLSSPLLNKINNLLLLVKFNKFRFPAAHVLSTPETWIRSSACVLLMQSCLRYGADCFVT